MLDEPHRLSGRDERFSVGVVKPYAERRRHPAAAVGGGAAAEPEIYLLSAASESFKHQLAHAECSRAQRLELISEQRQTGCSRHFDNVRPAWQNTIKGIYRRSVRTGHGQTPYAVTAQCRDRALTAVGCRYGHYLGIRQCCGNARCYILRSVGSRQTALEAVGGCNNKRLSVSHISYLCKNSVCILSRHGKYVNVILKYGLYIVSYLKKRFRRDIIYI